MLKYALISQSKMRVKGSFSCGRGGKEEWSRIERVLKTPFLGQCCIVNSDPSMFSKK